MNSEQKRKWEDPSQAYRQTLKLKPDEIQVHHNLDLVLVNLEQFEEAYECFKKVSSLKSDFQDVNNNKIKYTWLHMAIAAKARGLFIRAAALGRCGSCVSANDYFEFSLPGGILIWG